MRNLLPYIALVVFISFSINGISQISFSPGSNFQYLTGLDAANLENNWINSDFDDSSWSTGQAPFRYGDGSGGTLLVNMQNSYSTIYLRSSFQASDAGNIKELKMIVDYDDGFIIWINGEVALRRNAPDPAYHNSLATALHESGSPVQFNISTDAFSLNEGNNTLAILGLNANLTSSDFYFDLGIDATPEIPPLPEYTYNDSVVFSHEAGMYYEPFDLQLSNANGDYSIIYTLDGSDPKTSPTFLESAGPVTISVDPDLTENRSKTPGFIIRCALVKEGYAPSQSVTKTFLFPDHVADQTYPGGSWPPSAVNNQRIDYEMDPEVVYDPEYENDLHTALMQIPSISIVTDNENLFDPLNGIYVNAEQKGIEWERDCSLELIDPKGTEGFQVNAGLRIRGGNSAKNKNNPKHAFRLFFRSEYGPAKLAYPLFGEEGAEIYDCIDLRCEQNYSWSMDGSYHNTMIKDIFSRDLQGKMGQPYKRGRYYHLYLNGLYWGIFQTDERAEADFASTYFDGDEEDYDVIKVNTQPWPYYCEPTDGNMDSWYALWDECVSGFSSNEAYYALEGKKPDGSYDPEGNVLVDIDNLIDYMMVVFYTGNFDAPVSAWYSNDMPNNFYAIYDRENRSQGYKFLAHDSEHSMFVESVFGHQGVNENRVNIGTTGSMRIDRALDLNPQWLHYRLTENAEYRLRFSDRAFELLSGNGILSPGETEALFRKRMQEIDMAIIAESARWGDAQSYDPLTKNEDWLPEINLMFNEFFPARTDILINQLESESLYPQLKTPEVYLNETEIVEGQAYFSGENTITLRSNQSGTNVLYTLDGTDPRLPGGDISSSAQEEQTPYSFQLTETVVLSARIRQDNNWGPEKKIILTSDDEDYAHFKVTEIQYHPEDTIIAGDTISGSEFEFIEFKNTGQQMIDLSGISIDSAIRYTVPDNTLLAPGNFYVVASDAKYFFHKYAIYPSDLFSGKFSNSGERVLVTDPKGNILMSFLYGDEYPWPRRPDGYGHTLVSVQSNPDGDPGNISYWTASGARGGSPFSDDILSTVTQKEIINTGFKIYPNPSSGYVTVSIPFLEYDESCRLTIYSATGTRVHSIKAYRHTDINLAEIGLSEGIYFISIQTRDRISTERIIYSY